MRLVVDVFTGVVGGWGNELGMQIVNSKIGGSKRMRDEVSKLTMPTQCGFERGADGSGLPMVNTALKD